MPAVFGGEEVTGGTVQSCKSCPRGSDLSDSGGVHKSMGQGPELPEVNGRLSLLRAGCLCPREPPEVPSNLRYSEVH